MKKINNDKIIRWTIRASLILLLYHIGYIVLVFQKLPPIVPLFNQMPWGEARLAPKILLFVPFSISLCLFLLNIVFAAMLYEKLPLIARIISVTSLLICILGAVFIFRTMQLAL